MHFNASKILSENGCRIKFSKGSTLFCDRDRMADGFVTSSTHHNRYDNIIKFIVWMNLAF